MGLKYLLASGPALLALFVLERPMPVLEGLFRGTDSRHALMLLVACLVLSISWHVRNARWLLTMWAIYASALVAYAATHPEALSPIKAAASLAGFPSDIFFRNYEYPLRDIVIYNLIGVLQWGVGLPALKKFLREEGLIINSIWVVLFWLGWAVFALYRYTAGFVVWG